MAEKRSRRRRQPARPRGGARRSGPSPAGADPPAGPLKPESLRWRCDPFEFPETTAEIEPLADIIGQDRATGAIRLGLAIPGRGYNIFVAGFVGTGRNTTIRRFLEEAKGTSAPPPDLAYVNNFSDTDRPRLLRFPAGGACRFRRAMLRFVQHLQREIPRILESEAYAKRRARVAERFALKEREISRAFEEFLKGEGFALVRLESGPLVRPDIVPVVRGEPTDREQLEKLVEEGALEKAEKERLMRRHDELLPELREAIKKVRDLAADRQKRLEELEQQTVRPIVREPLEGMGEEFDHPGVRDYLQEVEQDVLARIDLFQSTPGETPGESSWPPRQGFPTQSLFPVYEVNVIVDNGPGNGAPVIVENFPTMRNLFGTIERTAEMGGRQSRSDFACIKAGSLIRASGGHLVLNANDVMGEPGVWTMLKRVLRTGVAEIQSQESAIIGPTSFIKPEPIDVDVKVVLIGSQMIYRLLYELDQDFRKIFKVKADFDREMPNDPAGRRSYARFISRMVESEDLLPFDRTGVAAVIEEGARGAGRADRLTTLFNDVADLLRESVYWARRESSGQVRAAHVDRAVRERLHRVGLVEDRIQEMLDRGVLLIDTDGERVGQVNGLVAYLIGDHVFGSPGRITAAIGMGRQGIVNIERESNLSGPTHDKGVLIISGLLRERFARRKPLTLSASLCFEQSYSGVEGDSASSAEIYALLSALAEVPLRQDLGVTGSVNQKGEVQPIGAVNEKIEGFFRACASRGLTGRQGVLIPRRNAGDLMLRREIVDAVAAGRFHIHAIDTIEEGIERLCGVPAGRRGADGAYPAGTLMARVDARLLDLAESIRPFGPADRP